MISCRQTGTDYCSVSRCEAEGQFLRQSSCQYLVLNGTDVIFDTEEFNDSRRRVIDAVCRPRVAIARLTYSTGIQKISSIWDDRHLIGQGMQARYFKAPPIQFSDKASLHVRMSKKRELLACI